MKKIIKILFVCSALFIGQTTFANTNIHLDIRTNGNHIYNQSILVSPCDSDNQGTIKTTAYCAIIQSGIQNTWDWTWAPGAFLTSLGGINSYTSIDNTGNNIYHYWGWYVNGMGGMTALNQYDLQENDTITVLFIEPENSNENSLPPLDKAGLPAEEKKIKPVFDISKANIFLTSQQKENGTFGEELYTNWATLALMGSESPKDLKTKLIKYFSSNKIKSTFLTDYERRAMAIMSLGLNPYNINGENYIEKIISSFDGTQFGDKEEDNDDIFALIVLQNAGYTINDKIISDDLNFIISRQKENGSWDNSIDMTGAAIQAMASIAEKNCSLLGSLSGVATPALPLGSSACETPQNKEFFSAINKAKEYLKQNQKDGGGFGNVSSTAWAMEGIIALNEKPEDWIKNNNTPLDYLAVNQDIDGGMKEYSLENRIWQTSYVLSIINGKTWNNIMQKFEKPSSIEDTTKTAAAISEIKKITKKIITKILTQNNIPPINAEVKTQSWFKKLMNRLFGL